MAHLSLTPTIEKLIDLALTEDLGRGDITTEVMGLDRDAQGTIICREDIIVCGMSLGGWIMQRAEPSLKWAPLLADGEFLVAGGTLAKLQGSANSILRIERTLLNFLMRMSGIATITHKYVETVGHTKARIVDTRKTMPGWRMIDKYAVRIGGGHNHRYDLGSGILIKDNHIAACGSVSEAVKRAKQRAPHPFRIQVEVEDLPSAKEAIQAGAEALLLDNMTPVQVREVVQALEGKVILEVSGGININTVRDYAEAGADIISVGSLTHSTRAVDLSLELK